MTTKFSTGLVNKLLATGSFWTIFTNGFLDIFSDTQPNTANDAPNSTKLVTLYSDDVSAGLHFETVAINGVITKELAETWSGIILASGDAGWFRLREAADDGLSLSTVYARWDGEAGLAGTQMVLKALAMVQDEPFVLTQAQFTFPRF